MISRPWTDDLPKCAETCVSQYTQRKNDPYKSEDYLCIYCKGLENDSCLYGVFDPLNGPHAARFVLQRMAAEILFGKLTDKSTDEEVKDFLRNAFLSVEKAYVESIDSVLAERTSLQYQLQSSEEGEIPQNFNKILERLKEIDEYLSSGTTVVVALIHNCRLYVANVGEARALLGRTDENAVLRVVQLSVDHSLSNEDELLRLSQLGLDINRLRNAKFLGNQCGTRCIGNYLVKGLYPAFPDLTTAVSEPVIAIPEVHGPIMLDDSCRFLVLVSGGVYKRLQDVKGTNEQINKQLAQMIVEQFRKQHTFKAISHAVLQQIAEQFKMYCYHNQLTPNLDSSMTLLIRNFNFPTPNARLKPNDATCAYQSISTIPSKQSTPDKAVRPQNLSVRFNPVVQSKSHTQINEISDNESNSSKANTPTNQVYSSEQDTNKSDDSTTSSSDNYRKVPYDRNRKVKSYVDFSDYLKNIEKAKNHSGLPAFLNSFYSLTENKQ